MSAVLDATLGGVVRHKEVANIRALCAEVEVLAKDAERLATLRALMGHVANGTDTVVSLCEDDATRDFLVSVGRDGKQYWFGETFEAAIDAATAARASTPKNDPAND